MPTYRHNRYNRCRIGPFVFDNHICHVPANQDEEFRRILGGMPRNEQILIVEINETALQNLERPVVVRGPATAASNPGAQASQASSLAVRRAIVGEQKENGGGSGEPTPPKNPNPTTGPLASLFNKDKPANPEGTK